MSLDDSQEEDCTVFIEELKSDNASLKVNAASKLSLIGAVLGYTRIRDELIPYIIEIIEQMDNDNEFLIKITESLLSLKQFCKNSEELAVLINPLKILASLDRPPVREPAIVSLQKMCVGQSKAFYEHHYMNLILSLTDEKGSYSQRVAACSLIPTVYPHVNEQSQKCLRRMFSRLALEENSPLVRRAVAQNIEELAKVLEKKTIRKEMLEIWQRFIVDPIDIVRIKALECAVVVARAFKKEETTQIFFKLIRQVDSAKKSWRIRYSLVSCLCSMLNYFDKQIIKKDIPECFEQLLKDSEAQVRAFALIKCPELAQKLSPQQSYTSFFQYYQKGAKDANKDTVPTVKLAVVEAIVLFLRSLQKAHITENGVPLITSLLKDENLVIRIGMVKRLHQLQEVIGKESTVQFLLPLLQGCLTDKKWRFKLAFAENITNLFKSLGYDDHKDFLEKIVTTFLKDHNTSVREQAMKCLSQLNDIIGPAKQLELIQKHVNALSSEANYIYRVGASVLLGLAASSLDKKDLSDLFTVILKKMESEKIANVLIAFFIMYSKIKGKLLAPTKKDFQGFARKVIAENEDEDVLHFATVADE